MSYPIAVPKPVEDVLTQASSEQLSNLRQQLIAKVYAGEGDPEALGYCCALIDYELQLRQVEPLWRKVTRFAKRNEEVLGVAAVIAGIAVGVDIMHR